MTNEERNFRNIDLLYETSPYLHSKLFYNPFEVAITIHWVGAFITFGFDYKVFVGLRGMSLSLYMCAESF